MRSASVTLCHSNCYVLDNPASVIIWPDKKPSGAACPAHAATVSSRTGTMGVWKLLWNSVPSCNLLISTEFISDGLVWKVGYQRSEELQHFWQHQFAQFACALWNNNTIFIKNTWHTRILFGSASREFIVSILERMFNILYLLRIAYVLKW